MKILLTHGWIKGNLGDLCITAQCIHGLRTAFPDAYIHLMSDPAPEWHGKDLMRSLTDRYTEEPYSADLTGTFHQYDAIVNVPGGGLQNAGDERGTFMQRDAAYCAAHGIAHVFAGHSFHPSFSVEPLKQSLFLAREPVSHAYLAERVCTAVATADPAFLQGVPAHAGGDRTLLFLRFDHFKDIRLDGRTLLLDGRTIELPDSPLVLSTSDPSRDSDILSALAQKWSVPYLPAHTLEELLGFIAESSCVIGDRYHPIIFSFMTGVPYIFVQRTGSMRDAGLTQLLDMHTPVELKEMAQTGVKALCEYIGGGR
jgi:polysaccharide pyruvyl transferase WcaK-like protein